jgi:hypothetical protein
MSSPPPLPSISISFSRILARDTEIFIYIRTGNIDRIKDLLIEAEGPAADALAPYSISALLLARIHGQAEVYQLLLSAGASQVPPVNIICPKAHLIKFWSNYISQDYGLSSSDIVRYYVYQHSSPHADVMSGLGDFTMSETFSFSRLRKSTLGLTCESLRIDEIDATDSMGRTALHLAAYQHNIKAIRILLVRGADPNIKDQYGKAPLHNVAATGSYLATEALILGGADLEVRDQFDCTPLHHPSLIGNHRVVELFVDSGSNIDALNCHLETPIKQAKLTDSIEAVQLLHQRVAAFNFEDDCGTYALQKSIWFNCHRVFRYLIGVQMRVDQRHKSRGTILHMLAEMGDSLTMEFFLEITHPSLAKLDPAEARSGGWTAMDHLEFRTNAEELREPFLRILAHVKVAQQRYQRVSHPSFYITKDPVHVVEEADEDDVFSEALEFQLQV